MAHFIEIFRICLLQIGLCIIMMLGHFNYLLKLKNSGLIKIIPFSSKWAQGHF